MMPKARVAHEFRRFEANDAVWRRRTPAAKGVASEFGTTRPQRAPALARKAAEKHLGWPSELHGGPRENGVRSGIGAIAAVGTKLPWRQ